MLNRYTEKQRKLNRVEGYTEFYGFKDEIQGSFKRWTEAGIDCARSLNACEFCSIYDTFGMHKDGKGLSKCWQAEANQKLLEQGIKMPKSIGGLLV
jgi:hypothetical protein